MQFSKEPECGTGAFIAPAIWMAAIEAAAKVCEDLSPRDPRSTEAATMCRILAAEIRKLAEKANLPLQEA